MVGLELACRARGNITVIREEEMIAAAPAETRAAREPLRWEAVSVEHGKRERWSVVPDGVFGLSFPDGTAAYFLLELDRGTIPISRRGGDHRSIRRKLKTYYDGWRAQRHVEQFGVKQMRVLTDNEFAGTREQHGRHCPQHYRRQGIEFLFVRRSREI